MEYLKAFIIGGILCAIGQVFIDKTKLTPARILVGFVVGGVILSALGFYEPLVEFAGAGATVPLSGFGHSLAKGVRSAVVDKGFLGILIRKRSAKDCDAFLLKMINCFYQTSNSAARR